MSTPSEAFRILSPTAILGYGYPMSSLERGLAQEPHLIAVDAGSTDPGPYYLGSGKSFTDRACVRRDLSHLLWAAVKRGIPLVVGTAGGSGAAPHLEWLRAIVDEIARAQGLSFRLGLIPADVEKRTVLDALHAERLEALRGAPELTEAAIEASTHIVAQMGHEPFIEALDAGCGVILAGRAYDPAVFSALPIACGYDPALALHLGKILECAAIAAVPGSGADCVLGTLNAESFVLDALNPERRFTGESTAAHTLYEKSDPMHLPGPGGVLDLEACTFEETGGGRVEVRGSRLDASGPYRLKLEGARRVGFRTVSVAGVRDPIMIQQIESIIDQVRRQVDSMIEAEEGAGTVNVHVYGRNGVMGEREPVRSGRAHELALVLEAVAETQARADTLASMVRSTLLHFGYPGRISTAGNLAFPFSPSDTSMGEVYEFSIYHLLDPAEAGPCGLFPVTVEDVGA